MLYACQPFNTFSAERLLDQTAILHHLYFLKVGPKLALGRIHRETSSMPERSRLTTILTPSHRAKILSRKLSNSLCEWNLTTCQKAHQTHSEDGFKGKCK